jgi:uncharacterized phage protein (predicted DNA packaging)
MDLQKITLDVLKMHLRIDHDEEDSLLLDKLEVAKSYIQSYTGLSDEAMKNNAALAEIALKIAADLYENRGIDADAKQAKINRIYESMLDMYAVNLL